MPAFERTLKALNAVHHIVTERSVSFFSPAPSTNSFTINLNVDDECQQVMQFFSLKMTPVLSPD